jgi:class 3 adenylate cyclase
VGAGVPVAAAAEGGEILASGETLAGADGRFTVTEFREVTLKGVPGPVRLTRVEWRSSR